MTDARPLRIGVLGAARIAPAAILEPARRSGRARVVALAARDPDRAQRFAREHGIEHVERDYAALVESPGVDAVYNALPASLHAPWTMRALAAGKHVLCEKPFALNANEAEAMVGAGDRARRVLLEAFHYRFHPLADRMRAIVESGEIGPIQHIEATFIAPIPNPADIRHELALGGGALMDLGCYTVHWTRLVSGEEPEVVSAQAVEGAPGVDMTMTAELALSNGASCRIYCSMSVNEDRRATLRVRGDAGELSVENPLVPHTGHRMEIQSAEGRRTEQIAGATTYDHQLDAFVAAVLDGGPRITGGADAIANMRLIDSIYRAAGMSPRG